MPIYCEPADYRANRQGGIVRRVPCSENLGMSRLIIVLYLATTLCSLNAGLAPLTTKDISLMLRSGYSSDAVLKELSTRKFADTLDSTREDQLLKAGASKALIRTLESGAYQLSSLEIAAWEKQKQTGPASSLTTSDSQNAHPVSTRPNPPTEAQMGGTMYDHLKDDLVYWHEGSLAPFDNETLERKRLYLLFFSAIWSKEGRQFTSQLVEYYNRVHPQHPEFEIVFFSADRSAFAMENYINQTNMPWPAVAYDKLSAKAGALAESLRHQIPRLILVEASGKMLSDSGEGRPDFDKVLADADKILASNKN